MQHRLEKYRLHVSTDWTLGNSLESVSLGASDDIPMQYTLPVVYDMEFSGFLRKSTGNNNYFQSECKANSLVMVIIV